MATPNDLANAATCYCFDDQRTTSIAIYLLASKAGLLGQTPTQLAASAKCYCYSNGVARTVSAYLLAVNAGIGSVSTFSIETSAACYCYDDATFRGVAVYLLSQIAGNASAPSSLAIAASCYCYTESEARNIVIYLLSVINGLQSVTPSALAASASCFCFNVGTWKNVVAYLLNVIGGGAVAPTLVVDIWQNFQFVAASGAMTAGQLSSSAQGPGAAASTWSLRGSNIFATSTNGEKKTISSPNGMVDNGTEGLNLLASGSVSTSVQVAFNPVDTVSAGIWFFAPSSLSVDSGIEVFQFSNSSGDSLCIAQFRRVSGVYTIRCIGSATNSDACTLTNLGAWYWITVKFTKSGVCSWAVYDANGNQVGVTITGTDTIGHQAGNVRVGPEDTQPAITPVNVYWDDLVIDYSHAMFPLGP